MPNFGAVEKCFFDDVSIVLRARHDLTHPLRPRVCFGAGDPSDCSFCKLSINQSNHSNTDFIEYKSRETLIRQKQE